MFIHFFCLFLYVSPSSWIRAYWDLSQNATPWVKEVACFIDNKWLKSLKWRSCDSVWKVSAGNSSNYGTSRGKTHYTVCCPSVCPFLPHSLFFFLSHREKTKVSLSSLLKSSLFSNDDSWVGVEHVVTFMAHEPPASLRSRYVESRFNSRAYSMVLLGQTDRASARNRRKFEDRKSYCSQYCIHISA